MAATLGMVEFVFIRHAQATHNVAAEAHGPLAYMDPAHRDAPLTDEGHLQTARVRRERGWEFMEGGSLSPAVVFCSPLRRCQQTLLGVIPAAASWPVLLDDRLMEPQSHVCNHRPERGVLLEECPAAWNLDGVAEVNPKDAPESVVARIRAFTAEMLSRYPGQRVLVVSHFTWIRNWFRIFKREVVEPANCSIMVARLEAKKLD
jgi:broad specificity phosphatase PhoE